MKEKPWIVSINVLKEMYLFFTFCSIGFRFNLISGLHTFAYMNINRIFFYVTSIKIRASQRISFCRTSEAK